MATWKDFVVTAKNRKLIRKSLDAIVCIAPPATTALATLIDEANELVIPNTYVPLGWHSEDGLSWAREVENSELAAHGSPEAVRTDVRRVNNSLEMTALETNIQTLGLTIGVELDPDAGSEGEVVMTEPTIPGQREFRLLALSIDDTDFGEIYFGKLYSIAKVTNTSPGAWSDGDNAQSYGLTMNAFRDDTLGWSVRHFIAGPGFAGLREDMGWNAATP